MEEPEHVPADINFPGSVTRRLGRELPAGDRDAARRPHWQGVPAGLRRAVRQCCATGPRCHRLDDCRVRAALRRNCGAACPFCGRAGAAHNPHAGSGGDAQTGARHASGNRSCPPGPGTARQVLALADSHCAPDRGRAGDGLAVVGCDGRSALPCGSCPGSPPGRGVMVLPTGPARRRGRPSFRTRPRPWRRRPDCPNRARGPAPRPEGRPRAGRQPRPAA